MASRDRRNTQRVAQQFGVKLRPLTPAGGVYAAETQPLPARLENLSRGGICISSFEPLALACVVHCEIALGAAPVAVPALMQVRWVKETDAGRHHCGLAYLF